MALAVILPKLDEAMRSGRIVKWLKKEGDRVKKGDILFELETEKVVFEVEAEKPGILSSIQAKRGDMVRVGATVAFILEPGEKAPEVPAGKAKPEPASIAKGEAPVAVPRGVEVKASPVAKRIAKEHNIDLSLVKGTGPDGRIVREDVLQAVEESKAAATPPCQEDVEGEIVPLSSIRETIAKRMTESFKVPHFYLTVEVDTRELGKTREKLIPLVESKVGIRLTITDLVIKAVAKALEDNPSMNCAYTDGAVKLFKQINIGLVTSVEGGLVVPVIHQANEKSLAEIAQNRAELVQKARDRKLGMKEMRGSTFTISNMGMFGIDQFSAILQPPEAAILTLGRTADKAVVRNGEIVIRPMMALTLSIDHRVLDGVIGADFLQSLKNYIEKPTDTLS